MVTCIQHTATYTHSHMINGRIKTGSLCKMRLYACVQSVESCGIATNCEYTNTTANATLSGVRQRYTHSQKTRHHTTSPHNSYPHHTLSTHTTADAKDQRAHASLGPVERAAAASALRALLCVPFRPTNRRRRCRARNPGKNIQSYYYYAPYCVPGHVMYSCLICAYVSRV